MLVLIGAVVLLHEAPDLALWWVEDRLLSAGAEIRWESASLWPNGHLEVEELEIRWEDPETGRLLRGGAPSVDLWMGLGWRQLVIRQAILSRPDVALEWEAGGDRREARREAAPFRFWIGRLTIEEGAFSLDGREALPISLRAEQISAAASTEGPAVVAVVSAGPVVVSTSPRLDRIDRLSGQLRLDPEGVSVMEAEVEADAAMLTASGRAGFDGTVLFSIRGEAELARALGGGLGERIEGRGRLKALVGRRSGTGPLVLARVDLPGRTEVFDWPIDDASGNLVVDAAGLSIELPRLSDPAGEPGTAELAVAWAAGGEPAFAGRMSLSSPIAEVRRIYDLDLPLEAQVSFQGAVRGLGSRWEIGGRLKSERLLARGYELGPVQGDLRIDPEDLKLRLDLEGRTRGEVTVDTQLGSGRTRVELKDVQAPLAHLLALAELNATPYRASARGGGWINVEHGSVESELTLRLEAPSERAGVSGEVQLRDMTLHRARLKFGAGVSVELEPAGPTGHPLRAEAVSADALRDAVSGIAGIFFPLELPEIPVPSGPVALKGSLALPPRDPLAFTLDASVAWVGGEPPRCEGVTARLRYADDRLEAEDISARCGEGTVTGRLGFGGEAPASAWLQARDVALPLPTLPEASGEGELLFGEEGLSATARFVGLGEGSIEVELSADPALREIRGRVVGQEVALPGPPALGAVLDLDAPMTWSREGGLQGRARVAVRAAAEAGIPGLIGTLEGAGDTVRVRLSDQTDALDLTGSLGLEAGVPFHVEAELVDFRPSPRLLAWLLGDRLHQRDLDPELSLSAWGRVDGSAQGLDRLEAEVTDLALAVRGRPVIDGASGDIGWVEGGLSLSELTVRGPRVSLTGRMGAGQVPRVEGKVQLALVEDFLPDAVGRGELELVYGDGELRAELSEGSLSHPDWPVALSQLRGGVRVDPEGISIEDIKGYLADGAFLLDGGITEDAWDVRVRAFPVTLPSRRALIPGLRGALGGVLRLTGPLREPTLAGTLRLYRGSYRKDVDLSDLIAQGPGPVSVETAGVPLALSVVLEEPVLVRNNVLKGRILGELMVAGSTLDPVVSGALYLDPGARLSLSGQRYEVERARVEGDDILGGTWRTELRASAEIRDYLVTLDLVARGEGYGPATFNATYHSDPNLPEEDVMALILFGTTRDRLPPGALQTVSGSLLLGPLVKQIEGRSRALLGVDRVRIEPYVSRTDDASTARVTVEKEVGDHLTLIYSTSAAQNREDLIIVEYSGLPGGRKATLTREIDGSVTAEISNEVEFGVP